MQQFNKQYITFGPNWGLAPFFVQSTGVLPLKIKIKDGVACVEVMAK